MQIKNKTIAGAPHVLCNGGCTTYIPLDGGRPCSILVCPECRVDDQIFRKVRRDYLRHMDEHIQKAKDLDKCWPWGRLVRRET